MDTKHLFEIDNLDANLDSSELRELSEVLGNYARYAAHKANATDYRLSGDINSAIVEEATCDNIYRALPPKFRKW